MSQISQYAGPTIFLILAIVLAIMGNFIASFLALLLVAYSAATLSDEPYPHYLLKIPFLDRLYFNLFRRRIRRYHEHDKLMYNLVAVALDIDPDLKSRTRCISILQDLYIGYLREVEADKEPNLNPLDDEILSKLGELHSVIASHSARSGEDCEDNQADDSGSISLIGGSLPKPSSQMQFNATNSNNPF